MTTLTVHYMMNSNPIPEKSEVLFAVAMDSWNPLRPFDDDYPDRPPHQLTFHDAERLVAMAKGKRQTAMFESSLIIEPTGGEELPFEAGARVTSGDFSPCSTCRLFTAAAGTGQPMSRGSPWSF